MGLVPRDLSTLLVDERIVSAEAMERASLRQRVCGGALDTALLELEILDPPALLAALSRADDLPPPPPPVLADPDPRLRRTFPAKLAERHGVAPFRLDGAELTVLATVPVDRAALEELSRQLGVRIVPHVAPEYRVRELNYRVHGVPVGERFERLAALLQEREAAVDPLAFDIDVVFELPPAPVDDDAPPGWTPAEARAALDGAATRDEVVRAVLRRARDAFDFAALFAVGRDRVYGHDALGCPEARERVRRLSLPISAAGALGAAVASGGPQLRRVPEGDPLLAALRRGVPHTVVLEPVLLRGKVAAVLYADNGDAPVSSARLGELLVFAAAVGPAFERILRRRKAPQARLGATG
jgi:hypothetical protein